MLYSATHHIYSPTHGHSCGETRTFGSLKAARLWAKSVLPESHQVSDEDYHRDMGRCSTVDIRSSKCWPVSTKAVWSDDPGYFDTYIAYAHKETVYPRIDIVPSVGQLGYW
jgi:hypothetical protein